MKVKFIQLKNSFFWNAFLGNDRFTIHGFLLSRLQNFQEKNCTIILLLLWNYMKTVPLKALTKKQYHNI